MNSCRFAAVASLALLLPLQVRGESFRPLSTQGTRTLKALEMELDLAVEYRDHATFPYTKASEQPERTELEAPRLGLNLGLADNAELQFDYTYLFIDEAKPGVGDEAGSGDARFFTKWRFFEQTKWLPDLAIHMGAKLPNADDKIQLGTDQADAFFSLLIGRRFAHLETAINLGLGILGGLRPSTQDDVVTYGIAVIYRPWEKLDLAAEIHGVDNSSDDLNKESSFRGAIRYPLGPVRLYLGGQAGLASRSPNFGVIGGLTWTHSF